MKMMLNTAIVAVAMMTPSSANAATFMFQGFLDGPSEVPPNASPGTGYTFMTYDDVAHTLMIHIEFSGLIGTTTASHMHTTLVPLTGTGGVATTTPTFAGFPLGVTSGTYDKLLDLTLASSFNPSFVSTNGGTPAGAEAALTLALKEKRAYLNVHSSVFPGGEIRSFLLPAAVPEPASWAMMIAGFALAGGAMRRRYPAAAIA